MEKRKIGKSELEVYPFCLGGNVFGWTSDEQASYEILDAYAAKGFNFIDTANVYSSWVPGNKGGESETIIGNWLKKSGKRNDMIISTKVGGAFSEENKGLKKEYIFKQVEESLRRLQTDRIDLYFTHYDDTTTPIEETLDAYTQLIKEGKVRYIGVSNMSAFRMEESVNLSKDNGFAEYICMQPEYNLYDRIQYEVEYEPIAERYGMGVVSYYSLASGFLTGKYPFDGEITGKRSDTVKQYMNHRGKHIIGTLIEVANVYDATPAQVALAWLMARPSITAPIASVSKVNQLDILESVDLKLSAEAIDRLNDASSELIS